MTPSALLLFAACPLLAPDLDLTWSDGVLGSSLDYALDGDAGEIVILLPSLTNGPTPLSLFFAGDPRVLDVGLDLLPSAFVVLLDPAGQAALPIPLSATPALAGVQLRAQAVSLDTSGVGSPFDDLSEVVQTTLSLPGQLFSTDNAPIVARRGHEMVRIPDGRVLGIGGEVTDASGNALSTDAWEIYDPQSELFAAGGSTLSAARSRFQATPLLDGRVLVTGGASAVAGTGAGAVALASTEIFDPVSMTFAAGPSMGSARVQHTATRLNDGRVFVVGGRSSAIDLRHSIGGDDFGASFPSPTEIFDPVTDTWSAGPSLPGGRYGHSATLLGDGTVLIAGGRVSGTPIFGGPPTMSTDEVLIFDPVSGTLTNGAPLPTARSFHSAVESGPGGVFLTGGLTTVFFLPGLAPGGEDLGIYQSTGLSTLTYDPLAAIWSPEPEPGTVTYSGETYCVDVGGGCFDYVTIDCPDDDMVAPGGSVLDRVTVVEKCGAAPTALKDDVIPPDDGAGHTAAVLQELRRIVFTASVDGAGAPSSAGVLFSVDG